jgi:hypothetical protein
VFEVCVLGGLGLKRKKQKRSTVLQVQKFEIR